ncbi:hypothetical protein NBRC116493_03720 [Aurantivibrio infirmus]
MRILFKTIKWLILACLVVIALAAAYTAYVIYSFDTETLPKNHGRVNTELFLGEDANQPLIVGLGGSEGGNAWASDYWKPQRDRFIDQGYALLALAYFGEAGVPKSLDRISLNAIHDAVLEAANDPKINQRCIAIMGGSRGAELALLLASHFPEFKTVIGIVPGHAVFTAQTTAMTTSAFSLNDEPLPFVPVPWSATPAIIKGDLRAAWVEMLKDKTAVAEAAIAVEKINGPVFLLSGTQDELWPSSEMSELMMKRLADKDFPYVYEHTAINGGHTAPQKHMNLVEDFLRTHFYSDNESNCSR